MIKNVTLRIRENEYEGECYHEVSDDEKTINFSAGNLCECPEDATLNRDLFNAHDYISALELGMALAAKGYTSINIIEVKNEEE